MADDRVSFEPKNRAEWRDWLSENHASASGAWVVIHKKASPGPGVSYVEAVEEALAFGWIDSRMHSVDEHRFSQLFTPRRPGGSWSKSNKERVARLAAQGLMHPSGTAAIEAAKKDGSWSTLDPIDNLEVPEDLSEALAREPDASRTFDAYSASKQRTAIAWVLSAKRPETRGRRIAEVVERSLRGERSPFPE
ncbi:MAG: YdeI/OmpD-associated family protein [Coriobacteriales bacterium]|nr:YdeI/OmpD-associated family protein [Coriobacteriales bacterium]